MSTSACRWLCQLTAHFFCLELSSIFSWLRIVAFIQMLQVCPKFILIRIRGYMWLVLLLSPWYEMLMR